MSIFNILKSNKNDVLFENSILYSLIMKYLYKITYEWEEDKFLDLFKYNFFDEIQIDFCFSLEKFIKIFNKNENIHVFLDKNNNIDIKDDFKNLLYSENYAIFMKCLDYQSLETKNDYYSYSVESNIKSNPYVKKMLNMIDILMFKMKFYTNVFFSLREDNSKVNNNQNSIFVLLKIYQINFNIKINYTEFINKE